jgi:hypothetical protein
MSTKIEWTDEAWCEMPGMPLFICPDCKSELVKTEIVDDEDGELRVVWVCRCEPEEQ